MDIIKKVLAALDKVKVVLKFIRALDAAIDAFKVVVEIDEKKDEKNN